jgi:hypothetical protein
MALNAKTDPNYVPKRINGKFAPGWSGNPGGSLEATRRSFNKDFLLALAADFKKHGAAAIEKVRKTQPAVYMKICALLVPREMQIEHSGGVKAMSDEEIEQTIAAIRAMLDVRADDAAKVIEGEAEVVPSLPAPGSGGTKMPKA